MYDLLIRNGLVVDGTGGPARHADVGITGERITLIGKADESAKREIDADGHVVSPGFVDGHTHMDAQLMWDPVGTSSVYHGVTSVVMGNCGFTLAPVKADRHDLVVRNLEGAEDISAEAMAAGIEWSWETFPEYIEALKRQPMGINYAPQIGHSALRTWAMGERAFEEAATEDDLRLMEQQVQLAMEVGALGFTTTRSQAHRTGDKRPVASRIGEWAEIVRLVSVLGRVGTGIFQSAFEIPGETDDEDRRREYTDRMVNLSRDTGVMCALGISSGRRGHKSRTPEMIDAINARGGRAFGLTRCRGINLILGFKTHISFDVHPEWQRVLALPDAEQIHAFKDPETRARLIHEAHHGHYDFEKRMNAEPRRANYDFIYILDRAVPPFTTVAEAARARGVDPVELMIDLAVETNLNQLFYQPLDNDDPENLVAVMKHPTGVMTFSDSGAHVTRIMDSSIQTHLLAYFVRDRQDFTLEEGVKMLTKIPAKAWDIPDRGELREGYVADINIFDPTTIAPVVPTVETDLPAGAKRLVQKATGFKSTIVGGQELMHDGEHTGALPGTLLLNRLARST